MGHSACWMLIPRHNQRDYCHPSNGIPKKDECGNEATMRLRRHTFILVLSACVVLALAPSTALAQAGQSTATPGTGETPPKAPEGASSDNILKQPGSTVAEQQVPEAASEVLTKHQKLHHWVKRSYSPYTFAGVTFDATWAQMWGDWPQYGGGMQGWGKRFGATLADTETRTFFGQFLFPVIFHQDPRYFPSHKQGLIPRAWYAGTRVLITRRDGDGTTFNTSEFAAVLATASLQNAYYPRRDKGFTETMNRFIGGVGSDATSNLLREFWPDIKKVFRKHEPDKMKELEKKIPGADKVGDMLGPGKP
jgi:hypothetical protein